MTLKERMLLLEQSVNELKVDIKTLQEHILNHTSVHKLDRIIQVSTLLVMTVIIVLLKFKVL